MNSKCYAARSNDEEVLKRSSSGGVFTEIAKLIFSEGGVVVGAGWITEPFRAVHKVAKNEVELRELCGSKYTWSDLSDVISDMQENLDKGVKVLFSGTPCQVAAIRKRFGMAKNLVLCSIICHSVPKNEIWRKFVSEIECKHKKNVVGIRFRDKRRGWRRSTLAISFEGTDNEKIGSLYSSAYVRAHFAGYSVRESCLNCQNKLYNSVADLIIGDFWGIERVCPSMDDDRGVSAAIALTAKGLDLLQSASLVLKEVSLEQIINGNPYLVKSITPDVAKRADFLTLCETYSIRKAFERAHYGRWWRRYPLFIYYIFRIIGNRMLRVLSKMKVRER